LSPACNSSDSTPRGLRVQLQPPSPPRLPSIALPHPCLLPSSRAPASTQFRLGYPINLMTADLSSAAYSFLNHVLIPSPTMVYVRSPSGEILMEIDLSPGAHTELSVMRGIQLSLHQSLSFHVYRSMTMDMQCRVRDSFLRRGSPAAWQDFLCDRRVRGGPKTLNRLLGHTDSWGMHMVLRNPGARSYPVYVWVLDVDVPSSFR